MTSECAKQEETKTRPAPEPKTQIKITNFFQYTCPPAPPAATTTGTTTKSAPKKRGTRKKHASDEAGSSKKKQKTKSNASGPATAIDASDTTLPSSLVGKLDHDAKQKTQRTKRKNKSNPERRRKKVAIGDGTVGDGNPKKPFVDAIHSTDMHTFDGTTVPMRKPHIHLSTSPTASVSVVQGNVEEYTIPPPTGPISVCGHPKDALSELLDKVKWKAPDGYTASAERVEFQLGEIDYVETRLSDPLFSPKWAVTNDETLSFPGASVPMIRMFGKMKTGASVVARIHGFAPYVYVVFPEWYSPPDREKAIAVLNDGVKQAHAASSRRPKTTKKSSAPPTEEGPFVVGFDITKKTPIRGYSNAPTSAVKITTSLPKYVPLLRDVLEKPGCLGENSPALPPYEAATVFTMRFMTDTGVTGCGWVAIDLTKKATRAWRVTDPLSLEGGGACKTEEKRILERINDDLDLPWSPGRRDLLRERRLNAQLTSSSRCYIEIDAHVDAVIPLGFENEWAMQVPQRILSFDTEMVCRGFPKIGVSPIVTVCTTLRSSETPKPMCKVAFQITECAPVKDATSTVWFDDERSMLLAWRDLVVAYDPDVITGYNIYNFDFPYMFERALALGIGNRFADMGRIASGSGRGDGGASSKRFPSSSFSGFDGNTFGGCSYHGTAQRTRQKKTAGRKPKIGYGPNGYIEGLAGWKDAMFSSTGSGHIKINKINIPGRTPFDMQTHIRRNFNLRSYKLEFVSQNFLGDHKLGVAHTQIPGLFLGTPDDKELLARYCLKDAELPDELIAKLKAHESYIEMARISRTPIGLLLVRGQQIKVAALLWEEAKKRGVVVDTPPRATSTTEKRELSSKFEGAVVMSAQRGMHPESVVTLDFSSLYPSIMISNNLCYTTLIDESTARRLRIHPQKLNRVVDDVLFVDAPRYFTAKDFSMVYRKWRTVSSLDDIGLQKGKDYLVTPSNQPYLAPGIPVTNDIVTSLKLVPLIDYDPIKSEDVAALMKKHASWIVSSLLVSTCERIREQCHFGRVLGTKLVTMISMLAFEDAKLHTVVGTSDAVRKLGILPCILQRLLTQRKVARMAMDATTDPSLKRVYDGRQLALKITANSVYGFTGAVQGMLPETRIAKAVTCKGREGLMFTRSVVLQQFPGSDIRYGDTDSVMVTFSLPETPLDVVARDAIAMCAPIIRTILFPSLPQVPPRAKSDRRRRVVAVNEDARMFGAPDHAETLNALNNALNELVDRVVKHIHLLEGAARKGHEWSPFIGKGLLSDMRAVASIVVDAVHIALEGARGSPLSDAESTKIRDAAIYGAYVDYIDRNATAGVKACDLVSGMMPPPMRLEFEKIFLPFLLSSKKRYCGIKAMGFPGSMDLLPGTASMGLETRRRDGCELQRFTVGKTTDMVMRDGDIEGAVVFCRSVVDCIYNGTVPIHYLVITCNYSNSCDDYKAKSRVSEVIRKIVSRGGEPPSIGDRIAFIMIEGPPGAKTFECAEDASHVILNRIPYSPKYYVEQQLVKPITRIMRAVMPDPSIIFSPTVSLNNLVETVRKSIKATDGITQMKPQECVQSVQDDEYAKAVWESAEKRSKSDQKAAPVSIMAPTLKKLGFSLTSDIEDLFSRPPGFYGDGSGKTARVGRLSNGVPGSILAYSVIVDTKCVGCGLQTDSRGPYSALCSGCTHKHQSIMETATKRVEIAEKLLQRVKTECAACSLSKTENVTDTCQNINCVFMSLRPRLIDDINETSRVLGALKQQEQVVLSAAVDEQQRGIVCT